MQAIDDLSLLREYATNNSEAAFETLVSRHIRLVYSAALRQTHDAQVAEEVTQVVFIILARKAGQIDERKVLSGWLFKTTRFVAMAQIRTAAKRRHFDREFHMQADVQSDGNDALWKQISPLLDEALMHLGEKDRQAVLLRFFEDQSLADIGSSLGTGEDAARMRINRALAKLHLYFTRRGISSTVAALAGVLSANSVHAVPLLLVKSVSAGAIAKGAVVSGSTLTLLQGGLKVMAWAKMKTAILVGSGLLFASGAGLVTTQVILAIRAAHYPNIQGEWEGLMLLEEAGVLSGEAGRTHVVLKLTQTNGVYSATSDWMELGRKDVPLGKVVYHFPSLQIERGARDLWKLKLNEDATQMVLDYHLHFIQPAPVLLQRTSTPTRVPDSLTESEFAPRAGSDLQGYWKGAIDSEPDPMPVELKITEAADGTFRAEGNDPMQGVVGRPVSVVYNRPGVTLLVATGTGKFEGTINSDNTMITGHWLQGGQSMPAHIRRADYQAEQAQERLKDYSFHSTDDLQGHWRGSWMVTIVKTRAKIRLALDIAKLPGGSYSAALSNIDQFGNDAPIPTSDFHFEPPKLRMKWKWADVSYEGKMENGRLVGTWFQGGGGFPLVFERSAQK